MRKILYILITACLLQACKGANKNEAAEAEQESKIDASENSSADTITAISIERMLPKTLPIKKMPFTDSTNFDNYGKKGIPAEGFIARTGFKPNKPETKNFRLNYCVNFAKDVSAVAITYQSGDHELFTTLVTMDSENNIIDKLDIAYDEIAESAFRRISTIQEDKIVVTSINWMDEEPIYESETYILRMDGRFIRTP